MSFHGSITALVTPFLNGDFDKKAYQALVERQIAGGTHGLVPVGTTGESPTLSHAEHIEVIKSCIDVAAGKVPVIAGTGSNSTREAIEFTQKAKDMGADGALVVTPYYNKPTQEGLYQHFKAIHDAVSIPIIIYNIPGRSVVDMTPETMGRLAKLPQIAGLKDATADLARVPAQRLACGADFIQLSGEDATALGFNAGGGVGCISVTSNLLPELCSQFQNAIAKGDLKTALALQDKLNPVHEAMFCEANPVPVKYALSRLGLCAPDVRLPLVGISDEGKQKVDQILDQLALV